METSPNNFQVPKHRRNPHLCKAYVRKILGPPRTSLVNLKPLVVSQLQQPAVKAYVQPMGARCRNLLGCFPKVLLGDTETMRLTWPAVSRGEKTATRYFLLYIIRLLFIWAVSICLYIYIYSSLYPPCQRHQDGRICHKGRTTIFIQLYDHNFSHFGVFVCWGGLGSSIQVAKNCQKW